MKNKHYSLLQNELENKLTLAYSFEVMLLWRLLRIGFPYIQINSVKQKYLNKYTYHKSPGLSYSFTIIGRDMYANTTLINIKLSS